MRKGLGALAAVALMAAGMPTGLGVANVSLGRPDPKPEPPRRSGYRLGRRHNYGFRQVGAYATAQSSHALRNGDKAAGTKLAKKAAKGAIGVSHPR
jgi:hypothetical protein